MEDLPPPLRAPVDRYEGEQRNRGSGNAHAGFQPQMSRFGQSPGALAQADHQAICPGALAFKFELQQGADRGANPFAGAGGFG